MAIPREDYKSRFNNKNTKLKKTEQNNMKKITRDDLIYLAGFLDGDGSIIAQLVERKDYKWLYQIRLTVQFTQKTKRLHFLNELQSIIDVGYIRSRGNVSDYVISEPKNVYDLLNQLKPFLRIKQKQANLVMKIIEQLPLAKDSKEKFLELCELANQVTLLNDSKNLKNTVEKVKAALEGKEDNLFSP